MKCPSCQKETTKVLDSRPANDGFAIRRRRECLKCHFRFSTYEILELLDLSVVKRDGHVERYDREKIAGGVRKALEKRPYSEDDVQQIVSDVERQIRKLDRRQVKTHTIGEIVMNKLRATDDVAYIRFASVYKKFRDAETFEREVRSLTKKGKK